VSTPMSDERLKLIGIGLERGDYPPVVHELYSETLRLRAEESMTATFQGYADKITLFLWTLSGTIVLGTATWKIMEHFLDEPWAYLSAFPIATVFNLLIEQGIKAWRRSRLEVRRG
jgi:hypothetical protein